MMGVSIRIFITAVTARCTNEGRIEQWDFVTERSIEQLLTERSIERFGLLAEIDDQIVRAASCRVSTARSERPPQAVWLLSVEAVRSLHPGSSRRMERRFA